jgi:Fe-S-cluster containining protein
MYDIKLPTCCMDMDIDLIDLVFPERMSIEGQEFVKAHGLDDKNIRELFSGAIDLGNGRVKIFHRCLQLADDGLCKIYSSRPKICKEFDCSKRSDCSCNGKGHFRNV